MYLSAQRRKHRIAYFGRTVRRFRIRDGQDMLNHDDSADASNNDNPCHLPVHALEQYQETTDCHRGIFRRYDNPVHYCRSHIRLHTHPKQ